MKIPPMHIYNMPFDVLASGTGVYAALSSTPQEPMGWLIDMHHAIAIMIGLAAGIAFRLSIRVHIATATSLLRELTSSALGSVANFWLAFEATHWFAAQSPPEYPVVIGVALVISASGTAFMQKAYKELEKRFFGTEDGPKV